MDVIVREAGFWHCDGALCVRASRDPRLPGNVIALIPDARLAQAFWTIVEYAVGTTSIGVVVFPLPVPPEVIELARKTFAAVIVVAGDSAEGEAAIECHPETDELFASAAMAAAVARAALGWDQSGEIQVRSASRVARVKLSWAGDGWNTALVA